MKKFTIIRNEGGSRVITITSFIPKDWKCVDITDIKSDEKSITIKIDKVK